jgi:LPS export ABC transporter protein LptC
MEDPAMRLPKILILIAVIMVIAYLAKAAFFKKQTPQTDASVAAAGQAGAITEQVRSFSVSGFSESGKKAWEMEGKTADIMSDVINFSDVNADSYGEETKVNLKADDGVFYKKSNDILLERNVVIVTDEGTKLTTDSLKWEAKKELISTEDHVFIERKDMDIEGTGASAKPDLKLAQLNKDVEVTMKERGGAVITCDGPLEVDYEKNIAYFYKNVKLDDGKTKIDTDKATAYFDPKERALTKVFCEGNVKILRGEDSTYADQLTYLPGEGRVVLTGSPKIFIKSDEALDKIKSKEDGPAERKKTD